MDSAWHDSPPDTAEENDVSPDRTADGDFYDAMEDTSPIAREDLPRPASFSDFTIGNDLPDLAFSFSEDDLLPSHSQWYRVPYAGHDGHSEIDNAEDLYRGVYSLQGHEYAAHRISVSRPLDLDIPKYTPPEYDENETTVPSRSKSERRSRRLSKSIKDFGRRDRSLSRKSPSPSKRAVSKDGDPSQLSFAAIEKSNQTGRQEKTEKNGVVKEGGGLKGLLNRKGNLFSRPSKDASTSSDKSSDPTTPPANKSPAKHFTAPLIKSMSAASLPSKAKTAATDAAGVVPSSKPQLAQARSLKRKDQLWTAFRSLDNDFQRYQSKSVTSKASFVRNNVLPFLRNYASHPSNKRLNPEDLERRTTILNKWWEAMLELLQIKNNQTVSGFDRPAILEGISGIMERPEWRAPPSPFCPIAELKMDGNRYRDPKAALNPETDEAEFFIQSIHHNVRNTFVHNLFVQITLVVDRMSSKNAPASLVKFSGKTCAYAFFFCPGVADVLVRHWGITSRDIRRVVGAFNVDNSSRLGDTMGVVVPRFPECVESLGFTSIRTAINYLKTKPVLPMGLERIKWHGSWISRWTGRESDLFYVFVKHFHILAADFLPPQPSKMEKICAPGFALVYAQMLRNLDSTFNRPSNPTPFDPTNELKNASFDGILDPDDTVSALPAPPLNSSRMMVENRFLLLLKEFLFEKRERHLPAKHMFAEGFWDILKAATRATSLFNHDACFALLDFLQEALLAIKNFEDLNVGEEFSMDWPFWMTVFRQMIKSDNMTTEMRLYTFLYSVWDILKKDPASKEMICLEFILDPNIFYSRFNHWCPMVRAYFMRMLCWRVGRFDGDSTESEIKIYKALMSRVQRVWSHYKFLAEMAKLHGLLAPPTAPCNPAPGRKLYIIRTEVNIPPQGKPQADGGRAQKSVQTSQKSNLEPDSEGSEDSLLGSAQLMERMPLNPDTDNQSKWKGGILRTMMGTDKSRSQSPKPVEEKAKSPTASQPTNSSRTRWNPIEGVDRSSRWNPIEGSDRSSRWNPIEGIDRSSRYSQSTLTPRTESMNAKNFEEAAEETRKKSIFKFTMEYVGARSQVSTPNVVLSPPRLPLAAQMLIETRSGFRADVPPSRPDPEVERSAKYAGRALAEWALVVAECQNFFERRRAEGVQLNKHVESPILAVDFMRRPF